MRPVSELLKKDRLQNGTEEYTTILEKVKSLTSKKLLLIHFNAKQAVKIQCNVSKDAIACCLLQANKSVQFASRSLIETEQMYAIIKI